MSKAFTAKLDELKEKGYEVEQVKVNFILFWTKEETGQDVKIVLPEMYLVKV